MKERIKNKLSSSNDIQFSLFAGLAAFATYFCMYAFRKPFGATDYQAFGQLLGLDFKILITISQLIGYCISKYIGVKIISETTYSKRSSKILIFIGCAFLSLLLFAISPNVLKPVFMFLNGLTEN